MTLIQIYWVNIAGATGLSLWGIITGKGKKVPMWYVIVLAIQLLIVAITGAIINNQH